MIIPPQQILNGQFAPKRVIYDLDNREICSPEGVGFDLRLAKLFLIGDDPRGELKVQTRRTPGSSELFAENGMYVIESGRSYLAQTIEKFDLPQGVAAQFFPRSTLFRSGLVFQSSILPPGYEGEMTFMISNHTKSDFSIELGARFSHVVFMQVAGDVNNYRGQWSGGRVSVPSDEEQI